LNLRDLLVFRVLSDTQSTTIAAERLGVTQSAVSQSVNRLEKLFGTTLLDRSNRPLRTTHAGEVLRHGVSNILQNVRRMVDEVQAGSDSKVPIVRLGLVDSFATTAGPEIVKALGQRVEQLLVWSGNSLALNAELLRRSLDVVISDDPMMNHSELARDYLFREQLVAAVPQALAKRFRGRSLEQMCAELPLVRPSKRSNFGQALEYYLNQRRINVSSFLELDSGEVMLKLVASGVGWTIMTPLILLHSHVQTMEIAALPLPPPESHRGLYVLYRPNELVQVTTEIIRICHDCVETLILPSLRSLAPWALEAVSERGRE
jgi:DNA-binding transcriptional LysR family regulator